MKRLIFLYCIMMAASCCFAQSNKQENRKNLTIKEWKRDNAGKGVRCLDHVTKYDAYGRKMEEVEYYTNNMLKDRCTYEYDANGKLYREVLYNERNKPVRIRKFEYNPDGTKKRQYNYAPNGKLLSVREFEYVH